MKTIYNSNKINEETDEDDIKDTQRMKKECQYKSVVYFNVPYEDGKPMIDPFDALDNTLCDATGNVFDTYVIDKIEEA